MCACSIGDTDFQARWFYFITSNSVKSVFAHDASVKWSDTPFCTIFRKILSGATAFHWRQTPAHLRVQDLISSLFVISLDIQYFVYLWYYPQFNLIVIKLLTFTAYFKLAYNDIDIYTGTTFIRRLNGLILPLVCLFVACEKNNFCP